MFDKLDIYKKKLKKWLIRERIKNVSRHLRYEKLVLGSDQDNILSVDDFSMSRDKGRFLGFYSEDGIRYAFHEFGIIRLLEKIGYSNIRIMLDCRDPYHSKMKIYGLHNGENHLLAEIQVHERILPLPEWASAKDRMRLQEFAVFEIEWLLLQNPLGKFTPEKPSLPGQKYPGLGLGGETVEILIAMAKRLNKYAYLNRPRYFHNAYIYSRRFLFLEPEDNGRFMAQLEAAGKRSLADISYAIEYGCMIDQRTGKPVAWEPAILILPINYHLQRIFLSPEYDSLTQASFQKHRFRFVWEEFDAIKKSRGGMDNL